MTMLRVVAAVVDTRLITLYQEGTGKAFEIPQGDPRVKQIVDTVLPLVQQGLVAEFHYEAEENLNPYRDFQEQTGGLVRFFRVAKNKLAGLFGMGTETPVVEEGSYGSLPAPAGEGVEPLELTSDMSSAVKDIISHAEPVTGSNFTERHTTEAETMIAVTGTGKEERILPGVEQIRGQLAHGAKLGSTIGVQRLIERLTAIDKSREHSVQDVLKFMEKGDLPVADDGTIIAYKRLYRSGDRFVDPHTRKVRQRVGSYVCVDESLVDRNRGTECSNGLHIGRRAYMGSFNGDVMVLCKIAPEDVVAVPHRNPNKVRVCGYHIIAKLGQAEFKAICDNKPMTDSERAKSLLARAIRGEHIGRIEEVRITKQRGEGLVITPLEKDGRTPVKGKVEAPNAVALDDPTVKAPDPKKGPEARADVKAVIETVTPPQPKEEPAPASPAPASGRVARMRSLYASLIATKDTVKRVEIAQEAIAFKKASKVGWQTLGLTEAESQLVITTGTPQPTPAVQVVETPLSAPTAPDPLPAAAKAMTVAAEAIADGSAYAPDKPVQGTSKAARAAQLYEIVTTSTDPVHRREAARQLLDLKKTSKKSWAVLGMEGTDAWLKGITDLANSEPPQAPTPTEAPAKAKAKPAVRKATVVSSLAPFPTGTRSEIAKALASQGRWSELGDFQKKAKVGWDRLGFSEAEIPLIRNKTGR